MLEKQIEDVTLLVLLVVAQSYDSISLIWKPDFVGFDYNYDD